MEEQYTLLLAEDDMNLGNLLKEYLEIKGFGVDLLRDGEGAMDAYGKKPYDLLILDVMMPKKDGFSTARDIRKKDADIPIIFLTAKSDKEDKLEGFESGADDYLTKPFSMEELLMRIKAIIKRTQQQKPNAQTRQ